MREVRDNWANRDQGLRCERCVWWNEKSSEVGRCRRRAPGGEGQPGWPVVFATDWCGDFRLDERRLGSLKGEKS